jgi:stage IV sporulation protein B
VGKKGDLKEGKATVRSCAGGTVAEYEIEIEEIYKDSGRTKNFLIRVTDERLLSITGGIVQGMSGSPIIQDGKLIGAVTHVLVNDPTRGYGIFIENMLEAAQSVAEEKQLKEAS